MPFSINRRRSASFLCSGFSLPLSSCGRRSKTIKYGNFSDPNRHTVSSIQYPETRTGPHIMHICVHIDVVPVAATSVCHITPYPPPYIYRYSPPFRGGSRKKMGWLGWHTDNYFRLRISVRWGGNISIVELTCNFSCTLVVAGGPDWGGKISCYTFIIFPPLYFFVHFYTLMMSE